MDILSPQENFTQTVTRTTKKRWFKKPLFYILIFVLVVVGYFSFRLGGVYNSIVIGNGSSWISNISQAIFGKKQIEISDPNPMPTPEADRLDVLILGIRGTTKDQIENEGGLLSDTMLVVSIDKKTQKAAMISIPRDLYIDMLGVKGKINEVYERGLERKIGLDLPKQIISKITGVYIDKAVVLDFDAFQHVVDNIGGVDVYLAKPFSEPKQWGNDFSLPAGNNHLNGEQALYYVRSRYSSSDFDRSRRQQEVITAIKNKIAKNGYLSSPLKMTDLLSSIKGDIKTDFQIWDINDVLGLAKTLSQKDKIKNYFMTTDNLLYETKNSKGEYILLPKGDNYDGIKQFFKDILIQETQLP